ncbi:WD40 repeat domain-containing protein [Nonomuraea thailandensis]
MGRAAAVVVVVVLVATTAVLAVMNVRAGAERDRALAQRDLALSRRLVAQSQVLAATEPRLARLLAVAAARIAPPAPETRAGTRAETRAAIRAAVAAPQLAVLRGLPGEVHSVAFSPDGATLAATGRAAPLRLWDVSGLTPVPWPVGEEQGDGMSVAYSADGGHLAVAGADGGVRVWDTTTRQAWTGGGSTPGPGSGPPSAPTGPCWPRPPAPRARPRCGTSAPVPRSPRCARSTALRDRSRSAPTARSSRPPTRAARSGRSTPSRAC